MTNKRTVLIGIDGVPYHLLETLSDQNIMPNLKDLRKQGLFTQMLSSIPEISSVSWSSIITGNNPGKHGIYGFNDMIPGTYTTSAILHNYQKQQLPAVLHSGVFNLHS